LSAAPDLKDARVTSHDRLPLFVFGTLRHDQSNHHYLAGHFDRWIPARLRGYARVAELMIDRDPGGEVPGELYFLKPAEYAATMAGCDKLEEIPSGTLVGHDYERRVVTVETAEGPVTAWAYVRPTPS
jgi:gamma-glutamylcyclotransferase (GGCT)/AIG2-like uncharacterized protein YtfP